jgi:hypothetical protein
MRLKLQGSSQLDYCLVDFVVLGVFLSPGKVMLRLVVGVTIAANAQGKGRDQQQPRHQNETGLPWK